MWILCSIWLLVYDSTKRCRLPSWPTWWALGSWCFSVRTVLKSRSVNCKQYQVKCLCCILCDSTFTSFLLEQTPKKQQRSLTISRDSSLFLVEFFCFCAGGGSCVYCLLTLLPFGHQRRVLRTAHDMWPSRETNWVPGREYHDCHHPCVSFTENDVGFWRL